eukprot:15326420-Ditylum_brightwellii.AAC.1
MAATEGNHDDEVHGQFNFTDIGHIGKKAHKKGGLSKWWLLLDNQSTVSIICNKMLLKNIRKAGKR